jgi:hypothetical protein
MTLYLRDEKNKTLFEAEVWVKTEYEPNLKYSFVELSPTVHIDTYSKFLLENQGKAKKIIEDFNNLSELRGWLWERFFMTGKNDGTQIDDVVDKLKVILGKVAKDYKLYLIGD